MKNNARHTKGFSLSELLVTTAVIAVLVSCSIPIFASKLENSRRAVDIANARTIKSAITNLLNDGTLTFLKDDMGYAISVTSGGINMGLVNGKWENVLIKGKKVDDTNPLGKNLFVYLRPYGVSNNWKVKQKSSSVTWYGVVVYGNGESYYYEGTGKWPDFAAETTRKYSWEDLDTPLSP